MFFIPLNVHNELFNGVRQLRWQHLSPVVSTLSTSIRLLYSFFIKHCILPLFLPLYLFQNQNNLYSTHVVAVNKILLYSVVYMYVVYRNSI